MGFFQKLDAQDFLLAPVLIGAIVIHIASVENRSHSILELGLVVFIHTSLLISFGVLVTLRQESLSPPPTAGEGNTKPKKKEHSRHCMELRSMNNK